MSKAVFIDRDGVINVDHGYVHRTEDFKFLPKVKSALKLLAKAHYKLVVITDQTGIGRGYYTEDDARKVNAHMVKELSDSGIRVDGVYFCPHSPEANCDCRKPKTAMIKKAESDLKIDASKSFFIGDRTRDVQTGVNAGCRTILVLTGKAGSDKAFDVKPNYIAKDLSQAARFIIDGK